MFSSQIVALAIAVIIAIMPLSMVLVNTFPIMETFAQVQSMDGPDPLQSDGLLLHGVNATSPAGREEDIYSIPTCCTCRHGWQYSLPTWVTLLWGSVSK